MATEDLDKAIDLDPKLARPYASRAYAHLKKVDELNPIALFEFPELGPRPLDEALRICKPAIDDCNKAILIDPDFALAYVNRAAARLASGAYDEGIADCNKALELDPELPLAYTNRASAHLAKGSCDEAIQDCNKALELDPKCVEAYGNRAGAFSEEATNKAGQAYAELGRFELHHRAIQDLGKAIEISPTDIFPYISRAYLYVQLGFYDLAIEDCSKAISINPAFALAYVVRAAARLESRAYDEAIYIRAGSDTAHRSFSLVESDAYHDAVADCNRALELDPDNVLAFFTRGDAHFRWGLYDYAIKDFDRAIMIRPRFAYAYAGRAAAYGSKGLHNQAIEDCNRALEIDPTLALAYYNKAVCCEITGRRKEAIAAYRDFIRLAEPEHREFLEIAKERLRYLR